MSKRDAHITDPAIARAMAHPLRVRILTVLDQRTASPSELAHELDVPLGNVSYHIRTLAGLGLIKLVSRKQRRGAIEHYYRAETRPLIADDLWGRLPSVVQEAMIHANLQTTGKYVEAAAATGGFARPDIHLTRTTTEVDEEAWQQISAVMTDALTQLRHIVDESAERVAQRNPDERWPATAVLMLFEGGEPEAVNDGSSQRRASKRDRRPPHGTRAS